MKIIEHMIYTMICISFHGNYREHLNNPKICIKVLRCYKNNLDFIKIK